MWLWLYSERISRAPLLHFSFARFISRSEEAYKYSILALASAKRLAKLALTAAFWLLTLSISEKWNKVRYCKDLNWFTNEVLTLSGKSLPVALFVRIALCHSAGPRLGFLNGHLLLTLFSAEFVTGNWLYCPATLLPENGTYYPKCFGSSLTSTVLITSS